MFVPMSCTVLAVVISVLTVPSATTMVNELSRRIRKENRREADLRYRNDFDDREEAIHPMLRGGIGDAIGVRRVRNNASAGCRGDEQQSECERTNAHDHFLRCQLRKRDC